MQNNLIVMFQSIHFQKKIGAEKWNTEEINWSELMRQTKTKSEKILFCKNAKPK